MGGVELVVALSPGELDAGDGADAHFPALEVEGFEHDGVPVLVQVVPTGDGHAAKILSDIEAQQEQGNANRNRGGSNSGLQNRAFA